MLKNTEDLSTSSFKGLNTNPNILALTKEYSPNIMDVKVNYDGSMEKRMGTNTQNAIAIANSALAAFSPDSASTLTTNLKSYWKLDEASDSRFDSFGMVTLLDSGNVGQTGGIKTQAALFTASTGNFLYQINPSTLTNNKSFSISSWVYLNSTSPTLQRTILSKRDNVTGSGMVLLLHMDGTQGSTTFTDSNSPAKTVTVSGSVQIDTGQYKFGGASGLFGGGGSYLSIADSADWDFGTSDFTVDFWVRLTDATSQQAFVSRNNGNEFEIVIQSAGTEIAVGVPGSTKSFVGSLISSNAWNHIAVTRNGSSMRVFLNGVQYGSTATSSEDIQGSSAMIIGGLENGAISVNGYMDELRILKGTAAWTANFTVPSAPYTPPIAASQFEYWLYVDTNNQATFDISSSGIASNASVTASSFGALLVGSWYNVVGWVDSSNAILGISVNLATNSASYISTVFTGSAPLTMGAINSGGAYFMDGRIDETGYWASALTRQQRSDLYNGGSGNTYVNGFTGEPWASIDFGASTLRWLTVSAGTGIYASSNLGVTFLNIATDRTATYQSLTRSKNVMIATSDAYDTPLYWAGSAGTFAASLSVGSAPNTKFAINFQGFLILLNSQARKRGFFYNDENTQIGGPYTNNFDIPSSFDDEITAAFILRRYLYVSTRYSLFRISFVGGNPDWSFTVIKDWGYIPRTVKKITITNPASGTFSYSIGEVAVGLTWDKKIRIFDGSGDQVLSTNLERDNGQSDFFMNNLAYFGSGPVINFAEVDNNQLVYKLVVGIGPQSSKTTHMLNFDARTFSLFPYQNMPYNTMVMAESANQRFLMAFDRSGFCHMMDSGNLDANKTPIDEFYESPILFEKTPAQSAKSHKTDFYFSNTTAGSLYYEDRIDFSNTYRLRKKIKLSGSSNIVVQNEDIDVTEGYNAYQFKLHSSAGTSDPWRCIRWDHFATGLGIGKND